jgi:hypothetical protein
LKGIRVGCPRNNEIFDQFEPKQTETQSVSVVFRFVSRNQKTFFFGLFRFVFQTGMETTKTNRTFSTKKKKSPKKFSIRGSLKPLFFVSRFEPELNLFQLFFGLLFRETKKFVFLVCFGLFDVSDRYQNKQNLWYGELKRLIFSQICCCFGCFETPKLPVSILKRNNRNKRLVSDSVKTSFGSSFGCFDTKLVSEDTLNQSLPTRSIYSDGG